MSICKKKVPASTKSTIVVVETDKLVPGAVMDSDAFTIYCGNLSPKVTEELLYELFLQAGPLTCVKIPKDAQGEQRTYGFIEYQHECSVDYAIQLVQGSTLFGQELQLKRRRNDRPRGAMHQNNAMPRFGFQPQMQMFRPPVPPFMHPAMGPMFPRAMGMAMGPPGLVAPQIPYVGFPPRNDSPPTPPGEFHRYSDAEPPGHRQSGYKRNHEERGSSRHNVPYDDKRPRYAQRDQRESYDDRRQQRDNRSQREANFRESKSNRERDFSRDRGNDGRRYPNQHKFF